MGPSGPNTAYTIKYKVLANYVASNCRAKIKSVFSSYVVLLCYKSWKHSNPPT